jgi:flagellar biosynthesis protein FliR
MVLVDFLTGLITRSSPSLNPILRRTIGLSLSTFGSILSMYTCTPSSCNFQRRSVFLAMRASSATARELFAERAVDGQAEDIAGLAEIRA